MKDGIGEKYTREDHQDLANQLFSSYARVGEARDLASVIGEDELSDADKQYLKFGTAFEKNLSGREKTKTVRWRKRWISAGGCCISCRVEN